MDFATVRFMRTLLTVGSLALFAACNPGAISDVDPFIGTYHLVTVGGAPLPVVGSGSNAELTTEVLRADVILNADHSATRVEYARVTPAGRSTVLTRDERSGTFTITGDVITVTFPGATPYTGSVGGERLFLSQGTGSAQPVEYYQREQVFE